MKFNLFILVLVLTNTIHVHLKMMINNQMHFKNYFRLNKELSQKIQIESTKNKVNQDFEKVEYEHQAILRDQHPNIKLEFTKQLPETKNYEMQYRLKDIKDIRAPHDRRLNDFARTKNVLNNNDYDTVVKQGEYQPFKYERVVMKRGVYDDMNKQTFIISHKRSTPDKYQNQTTLSNDNQPAPSNNVNQKQEQKDPSTSTKNTTQVEANQKPNNHQNKDQQEIEQLKQVNLKQMVQERQKSRQIEMMKLQQQEQNLNNQQLVMEQIKQQYSILNELSSSIKDKDWLYSFAFKLNNLMRTLKTYQQQMSFNIQTDFKILGILNQNTYSLRQKIQKIEENDSYVQKMNDEVVQLNKSQFELDINNQMNLLLSSYQGTTTNDFSNFITKYCNIDSQQYRISHRINIKMTDKPLEALSKLQNSVLFSNFYTLNKIEESSMSTYSKFFEEQNQKETRLLNLLKKETSNVKSFQSLILRSQQIKQDLQEINDRQINDSEDSQQDIQKLMQSFQVQAIISKQAVKTRQQSVVDEEDDYIKTNNLVFK